MFNNKELLSRPFYAGEGEGDGDSGGSGDGEGQQNQPNLGEKVYNQQEFDAHMGGMRKKYEKQIGQLQEQMKTLKLSDKDKKALQGQVEEMQAQLRTSEEQREHEKNKLEKGYQDQITDLQNQTDFWSTKYTSSKKTADLLSAASHPDHEAYNPSQIVSLLENNTKVVRKKDDDGNELDTFETVVAISLPDTKTKQMTELVLSPKDAVKRMSEATELYGNLFKSNLKGGFDGTPNRGGKSGETDLNELAKTDPAAYRRERNKQLGRS